MFNETKELMATGTPRGTIKIIPIAGVFCVQYVHGCTSLTSSGFNTLEEAERYVESSSI